MERKPVHDFLLLIIWRWQGNMSQDKDIDCLPGCKSLWRVEDGYTPTPWYLGEAVRAPPSFLSSVLSKRF